ncbi:MAG: QueT transporter family protein [Oscillospiraceae bacterium]|jgi:uncharacterized membrane protein|nr:QueT transporter family protein [Oscillospiraceae bacterium]
MQKSPKNPKATRANPGKSQTTTHKKILFLVQAAIIAALYAGLTFAAAPISYGSFQFRISEALTILPALTPAAIPGLALGCVIANFGSPLGLVDVLAGSAATLAAATLTYLLRKVMLKGWPVLAPLPPVLLNGLVVGAELACLNGDLLALRNFTWAAYAAAGFSVAFGELVVCYVAGLPLYALYKQFVWKKIPT